LSGSGNSLEKAVTGPADEDDKSDNGELQAALLTKPITSKRITAPMKALTIAARIPPARINPMCGNSQPANEGTSNAYDNIA
jgi:hypothetical protein